MKYETNSKGLIFFELKSWLGRNLLDTRPQLLDGKNYLNLACGSNIVDGYINADFFYRFKFWKKDTKKIQWQLDLRYPLNCANGVFDGIHVEHALEHFYPDRALILLKELHRILKKNSRIRITVPGLEKYIRFYNGDYEHIAITEFKKRYINGCTAIRNLTQNYFHFSVWDYEELERCLSAAGFKDIQKMAFGHSNDEKLLLDLKKRDWETLYVEAVK